MTVFNRRVVKRAGNNPAPAPVFQTGEIVKLVIGTADNPTWIPAKVLHVGGCTYGGDLAVQDYNGLSREAKFTDIEKADAAYQQENAGWF